MNHRNTVADALEAYVERSGGVGWPDLLALLLILALAMCAYSYEAKQDKADVFAFFAEEANAR